MPRNEETEWYDNLTRDLARHLEQIRKEVDDFEARVCREVLPLLVEAVDRATKPEQHAAQEVKFRELLRKYISYVYDCDGADFIEYGPVLAGVGVRFAADEWQQLRQLAGYEPEKDESSSE